MTKPTLFRTLTVGSFPDGEGVTLDEEEEEKKKRPAPIANRKLDLKFESTVSEDRETAESSDDDEEDDEVDALEWQRLESLVTHRLAPTELEAAARTSYAYLLQPDPTRRLRLAAAFMRRHLAGAEGKVEAAVKQAKATLAHREKLGVDAIRTCFDQSTPQAVELQRRIQKYCGPLGRYQVLGYDKEGRALLHLIFRNSAPYLRKDEEGFLEATIYTFEKAVACTERKTNGKLGSFVLCLDAQGIQPWQLSLRTLKEMLLYATLHSPERIHTAYGMDGPSFARLVYRCVDPALPRPYRNLCQFVNGKAERARVFESVVDADQCPPTLRPDGQLREVDMERYFSAVPFDKTYNDVFCS